MTFTSEFFAKRKDILKSNKGSCCEQITGDVNIYLHGYVS